MKLRPENQRLIELVSKDTMAVHEQYEAVELLLNSVISYNVYQTMLGAVDDVISYAKENSKPPICPICGRPLED